MAKILFLTNALGGLYSFRRELIQELLGRGYEVSISAPHGDRAEYFCQIGCQVIETPFERRSINLLGDLRLFLSYWRLIRTESPDIVLTYTIKPNIYGGMACRLLQKPYIANITGLGSALDEKGILRQLSILLYRAALGKASCVFFQNQENRQLFLGQKVVQGRQRLIPGSGVNLEYFSVLDYPPEDTLNFLFIGRVMKLKGIEEYLEAAEFIASKYENTVFHVLGSCEEDYEQKLYRLQAQGVIQYHGRQKDVRPFHKLSHCTIHPTYYPEGMSNVVLESAACGRPVITTDRSGCREVVGDGVNGFLVPERDIESLIAAIERFIVLSHEDKKKMGLAGRAKVEREFDRNMVIEAYAQEIENCLRALR